MNSCNIVVDSGTWWKKVGDKMFLGEYHHNIDEKGRIVLPSKFRTELKDKFIIARGIEKCLYVYSLEDWNKLVRKLETLPFTKKDARTFIRSFFSGATFCEFDQQGRTCITSPLVRYADLTRECVIIGANDRIEIWNQVEWEANLKQMEENLSDIAENLFMDVNL